MFDLVLIIIVVMIIILLFFLLLMETKNIKMRGDKKEIASNPMQEKKMKINTIDTCISLTKVLIKKIIIVYQN